MTQSPRPRHDARRWADGAGRAGRRARHATGAAARAANDAVRRWRAIARLVRVDAPTLWRLSSHAAVLLLTLGALLATRVADRPAAAADAPASPGWIDRVGDQVGAFIPRPVLVTSVGAADEGAPAVPEELGFVSPGLTAESDPTLLPFDEPQVYFVQENDTLSDIANRFGITPERLLYYNPELRADPHNLSIGDEVTILSIDGVRHVVAEGDTLASIAEAYGVSVMDLVAYAPNGVTEDSALEPGMDIVAPGGSVEINIEPYFQQVTGAVVSGWTMSNDIGPVAGTGSFNVATFGSISNGYHRGHAAIDLAARTGTPIYAVDGGSVEFAGWHYWAGNAVSLDHGNGYKSFFAHMNSLAVSPGQTVQRGQIIGTVGCTRGRAGRCTGPHLHLEIYYNGAPVNPCSVGACP